MKTPLPPELFSRAPADAATLARSTPMSARTEVPSDLSADSPGEEILIRLRSLQEWICELLIKNQQLRMALMEAKSREQVDGDGCNA